MDNGHYTVDLSYQPTPVAYEFLEITESDHIEPLNIMFPDEDNDELYHLTPNVRKMIHSDW